MSTFSGDGHAGSPPEGVSIGDSPSRGFGSTNIADLFDPPLPASKDTIWVDRSLILAGVYAYWLTHEEHTIDDILNGEVKSPVTWEVAEPSSDGDLTVVKLNNNAVQLLKEPACETHQSIIWPRLGRVIFHTWRTKVADTMSGQAVEIKHYCDDCDDTHTVDLASFVSLPSTFWFLTHWTPDSVLTHYQ